MLLVVARIRGVAGVTAVAGVTGVTRDTGVQEKVCSVLKLTHCGKMSLAVTGAPLWRAVTRVTGVHCTLYSVQEEVCTELKLSAVFSLTVARYQMDLFRDKSIWILLKMPSEEQKLYVCE